MKFAIITFRGLSVLHIFHVVVRLTSKVEQAERQKETVTRSLSSLCDAFVQLSGSLRIELTSTCRVAMLVMQDHMEQYATDMEDRD